MQIAVAPTVFVALGGTGQIVLQRLRERLVQRVGTADLPFFRYLYVDTHEEALSAPVAGLDGEAAGWSVTNQISLSDDAIRKLQNETDIARRLRINDWFDPHARAALGTVAFKSGVNGRRMYSRLGFLASQNLGTLRQILTGFYSDLITAPRLAGKPLKGIQPPYLSVRPTYVDTAVRFVVVTSAGGGTGSGCFIDFGFLLRKLRADGGWANVHQFGHVALARSEAEGDTLNQVRNSAALLTELDFYDGSKTYQADYLILKPSHFEDRNPPYDITYVVAAKQGAVPLDGDRDKAFDLLLWRIAEFLLTDAVAVYEDTAKSVALPRSGPVGAVAFMGDMGLNPPAPRHGLSTYGIACREWPAAMVHRQLYGAVIRAVAESWNSPQDHVVAALEAELRGWLGIPDEATQLNQTARNKEQDKLLKALLEPVEELDPCRLLDGFREEALNARGQVELGKLAEIQEKIRRQFERRAGGPVADLPGAVYAIVQTNLKRLTNPRAEDSLPRQVADRLLDLCVQTDAGPATAAQVALDLRKAVRTERDFVVKCLEDLKPDPGSPPSLDRCWQYANDCLLQEVLRAKEQIYRQMDEWLTKLYRRLQHLTEYVRNWARGIPSPDDTRFAVRAPSIVHPKAEVDRLKEAATGSVTINLSSLGLMSELRALVERGLPEQDDHGQPTLFAAGPPRRSGATDFSYLEAVERAIFDSLARGPASPYQVAVLGLLQQEAEAKGLPLTNLIGESQFLLNFKKGDAEYAGLPFGGNPTHVTEIVQPNQPGYPEFQKAQAGPEGWLKEWASVGAVKRVSVFGEVTPDVNRFAAAYVCERCSIISRFIVGYDYGSRRALFDKDPNFPAVTDVRIKLPPSDEALRRARCLWLGSLALQAPEVGWVYLGGDPPQFEFTFTEHDEHGFAVKRKRHTSADYETATWALADTTGVMDANELAIRNYLKDNRGAAATAIKAAADKINEQAMADPGKLDGDLLWLNVRNVNYENALNTLVQFAVQFGVELPKVPHPYAQFLRARELKPDGTPAGFDGWYCTRCGHSFGLTMPLRNGKCESCGNPFGTSES